MEPEYEYGDDGIPVLIDHTSNPSSPVIAKPPSRPRRSKDGEGDFSAGATPGARKLKGPRYEEETKAVFTIDGEGFDVILSEKKGKIIWSSMNALGRRKKSGRKLSGFLRGRRPSITDETDTGHGISLSNVFGVHVKRRQKTGAEKDNEGFCLGLVISMLEYKNENTSREKVVFMEHPSDDLCSLWEGRISNYIKAVHPERPVTVKLFLQPHAGNKTGRNIYHRTVLPLFQSAGVSVDLTEVAHNEFAKQELIHLNLDDYDCIACMGGDGTVSQVVDALMNRAQREGGLDMKHGSNPAPSPLPFGIIPTGRTNTIAQSVMGVSDPVTAALHIIHGNFHPVDICSIYTPEKFLRWGFNCQYGFAGQVLTFMRRYKALGSKRVDAAFVKALTKAKLRAYQCDIEYIPADISPKMKKDIPCTAGCSICASAETENSKVEETAVDIVQELDPLNQSFTSNASSVIDLPQDSPWRTVKGKYMNVGLFVVPGLCDFAPAGLSKFTHLNDGVIDLVLVKEVAKKEYVRHLRRHGNSKNQFDFPFVEIHKVKEVRFRPRFPISWNYNDHDFSEIKYQMERVESKAQNHNSMEVINDLEREQSFQRSHSVDTLDISDDDEDEDDTKENGEGAQEAQPRLVGPQYRKTFTEIEIERRRKIARKKEEKTKAREESKMVAVWNIDNQIQDQLELDFKIHHGLIRICGLGVSQETKHEEVRLGCLTAM